MTKTVKLFCAAALALATFTASAGGYQIGETVKSFTLKNVNGKMVSLDDYKKSKGVMVIFTCNHCPFSKMYEQRIIDLHKTYTAKGYDVVAINSNDPKVVPDDSYDKMVDLARKKKYPFPYLYDETQDIARAFGATRTPHVFVLANEGNNFVIKYIGAIDNNAEDAKAADKKYVNESVNELLAGKEVTTKQTKAIGCSIKWKVQE
ncbi:MAG TPA: thioredoxin family protein [Bacteroidia bacterium]|nr:thioredoxin family protein [Bacteroidia bacterium]HNU33539.1 thioredoxin family protein [Bacteroidia bacterium]